MLHSCLAKEYIDSWKSCISHFPWVFFTQYFILKFTSQVESSNTLNILNYVLRNLW